MMRRYLFKDKCLFFCYFKGGKNMNEIIEKENIIIEEMIYEWMERYRRKWQGRLEKNSADPH